MEVNVLCTVEVIIKYIIYILTSKRNASPKSCITCYMYIMQMRKWGLSWNIPVFHIMKYWKFGSVFNFVQNSGGSAIYKDAPCARGSSVFATEFRKSLWKLFHKQEIIKILKWRFAFSWVTNTISPFGASLFSVWRLCIKLCCYVFLLTSLRKD